MSQSAAGSIFVVYLVGIFASAWIGSLADRVGRGRMLVLMTAIMLCGIGLTTLGPLVLVITGIATVTFGFFGAHTVASSWIGLRARLAKAQASGLYFFFYYMGSSVAGAAGGMFWDRVGWSGVAGFVAALVGLALLLAVNEAKRARVPVALRGEAA